MFPFFALFNYPSTSNPLVVSTSSCSRVGVELALVSRTYQVYLASKSVFYEPIFFKILIGSGAYDAWREIVPQAIRGGCDNGRTKSCLRSGPMCRSPHHRALYSQEKSEGLLPKEFLFKFQPQGDPLFTPKQPNLLFLFSTTVHFKVTRRNSTFTSFECLARITLEID